MDSSGHFNTSQTYYGYKAVEILDPAFTECLAKVNSSPSHPPAKRLQSHIIHNTPRNFQPTLTTIPPALPNPSHTRPALNQEVGPSPIPQPRNSPMVISQQPQPVASTSRRREELSPFPFPASPVFQHWDQWPIQATREYPNTESYNQDGVASLFRRVSKNSS
ncbi:hypothetical protein O181_080151 [Austropuccinia psidii MF-1]|uniref:Uncharacterized protein n=1 Tax=Austropuccinia psidii MF-1 TaxID=1389203 RepID=A0A9Q3FHN5_9BASI|nr:hypothetical protein [Austropuccinia psidii MF-1]